MTPVALLRTPGERLAKARHAAGLSQEEMARCLGISRRTVVRLENDDKLANEALIIAWAHFTPATMEWLRQIYLRRTAAGRLREAAERRIA